MTGEKTEVLEEKTAFLSFLFLTKELGSILYTDIMQ
jgi:hypothetical protein